MPEINRERELEIIEGEIAARGGKRPGAGRPRGSKNKQTKKGEKKARTVKDRVYRNLDSLITAKLSLAKGNQYLFEIKMRNKGGKRVPQHTLVTDPKKIKAYMDGEMDEDSYFYVTAEKPDNKAIEDLLDRAFGRSTTNQQTDHNFNVNVMNYEQITAEHRETLDEGDNNSVSVPTEVISAGNDVINKEIQDSGLAQAMREDKDGPKRAGKKSLI